MRLAPFLPPLLLGLAACAPRVPAQAPTQPTTEPATPPTAEETGDEIEIPAATELTRLPERFAGLGQACESIKDQDVEAQCDDTGTAVGLWAPVDTVYGVPPEEAELVHDKQPEPEPPGVGLTVGLEGGRLWIRHVTCARCRRVMGWAYVGELPELTDLHLREIQARLGLPSDPVLRTPDDWRAAFADG